MSIVPLLFGLSRDLDADYGRSWADLDHLDDDFGFGIHPMDIFRPRIGGHGPASSSMILHPRRHHSSLFSPYRPHMWYVNKHAGNRHGRNEGGDWHAHSATSQLTPSVGKDGFQVCMDVSKFKPNELTVKTVDRTIVVEGKHEEREDDHGFIQRHFVRKYMLPKDFDPKEVVSTISSDGVLTVKAPPPPAKAIQQNERVVQIQQTGPAHLSVKAPQEDQQQQQDSNGMKGGKQQQQRGQTHNGEAERMKAK